MNNMHCSIGAVQFCIALSISRLLSYFLC